MIHMGISVDRFHHTVFVVRHFWNESSKNAIKVEFNPYEKPMWINGSINCVIYVTFSRTLTFLLFTFAFRPNRKESALVKRCESFNANIHLNWLCTHKQCKRVATTVNWYLICNYEPTHCITISVRGSDSDDGFPFMHNTLISNRLIVEQHKSSDRTQFRVSQSSRWFI